ncbi:MAG: 50S ribosomal protein L6 [Chloroflexi bacterium]|nr:50S ribosomal protein L6 [Chloroflexota bacterium]
MNEVKQEKTLSRIGRKPIAVPSSVTVEVQYGGVKVTGPKGTIEQKYHPEVVVKVEENQVTVERQSANKFHHSLHGLTRSLIANAIEGVSEGFTKSLDVMGVGYRCSEAGKGVTLNVGYSHSVDIFPEGDDVTIEIEGNNKIFVRGIDKQKVGQLAARIRRVRPPNAYKEKGIKYSDEVLHFKPGKAAARKA